MNELEKRLTEIHSLRRYIMETKIFEFESHVEFTIYKIPNTSIRLEIRIKKDKTISSINWDVNGSVNNVGDLITLEQVLELVDQETKMKLLFNLDLFLDLERGQREKYYCRD